MDGSRMTEKRRKMDKNTIKGRKNVTSLSLSKRQDKPFFFFFLKGAHQTFQSKNNGRHRYEYCVRPLSDWLQYNVTFSHQNFWISVDCETVK